MIKISEHALKMMQKKSRAQKNLVLENWSIPVNGTISSFQIFYESNEHYKKGRYVLRRNKFKEVEENE